MFTANVQPLDQVVRGLNTSLDKFVRHARNQAVKAGITAAAKPVQAMMISLFRPHASSGTPVRKLRRHEVGFIPGTNIQVTRPHLHEAVATKVWRIPDSTGYYAYVGPVTIEVPHAHWFEKGPKNRYTRDGRFTGSMPDYMILTKAYQQSINQATVECEQAIKSKLESFQGD